MTQDTICVVCDSHAPAPIVATEVKSDPNGHLRVVQCVNCGHTQLSPPLYDLELYDEDGQIENVKKLYGTPSETIFRHAIIEARRRTERLSTLDATLLESPRLRCRKLLDVGGGYGFFGAQVAQMEPQIDVVVLEPSARRLEMGRVKMREGDILPDVGVERLDFRVGLLDDGFADEHAGKFDIVTLWHVLEHVPRPAELLRLAARVVHQEHGIICVEVPNLNDDLMRQSPAFRARSFMMEHISYFSPDTLASVARRAIPGARIELRGYQRYGIFNYMHWIAFNAPQGADPDMFDGTDRWWLESMWRVVREQTMCSDALYMVIRVGRN